MKQTKEDFMNNVREWAKCEEALKADLENTKAEHPLDLDIELSALLKEACEHETKMLTSCLKLSQACKNKLESL